MSYSLWLENKDNELMCKRKEPEVNLGTMLCIGGSDLMEFNITYNYAHYYYEVEGFEEDGIRKIYGMTGKESLPYLDMLCMHIQKKYYNRDKQRWKQTVRQKKVPVMNGEVLPEGEFTEYPHDKVEWKEVDYICDEGDTRDYWQATAKNAFDAIQHLIKMAEECPDGVWNGD